MAALLALLLGGCGVGSDAVAAGGSFTFVAPGGQTRIFYDPPQSRGTVRGLSGESLLGPARTVGLDNPGRSLAALRGFPRNTVPSTIVLDREHRVAAVFLTAVRVGELLPVVQRIAAEQPGAAARAGS